MVLVRANLSGLTWNVVSAKTPRNTDWRIASGVNLPDLVIVSPTLAGKSRAGNLWMVEVWSCRSWSGIKFCTATVY